MDQVPCMRVGTVGPEGPVDGPSYLAYVAQCRRLMSVTSNLEFSDAITAGLRSEASCVLSGNNCGSKSLSSHAVLGTFTTKAARISARHLPTRSEITRSLQTHRILSESFESGAAPDPPFLPSALGTAATYQKAWTRFVFANLDPPVTALATLKRSIRMELLQRTAQWIARGWRFNDCNDAPAVGDKRNRDHMDAGSASHVMDAGSASHVALEAEAGSDTHSVDDCSAAVTELPDVDSDFETNSHNLSGVVVLPVAVTEDRTALGFCRALCGAPGVWFVTSAASVDLPLTEDAQVALAELCNTALSVLPLVTEEGHVVSGVSGDLGSHHISPRRALWRSDVVDHHVPLSTLRSMLCHVLAVAGHVFQQCHPSVFASLHE